MYTRIFRQHPAKFLDVYLDTLERFLRHIVITGLDWTGLDWTGLDWTGLDWTGLDWTGLDWTFTIFQFKSFF